MNLLQVNGLRGGFRAVDLDTVSGAEFVPAPYVDKTLPKPPTSRGPSLVLKFSTGESASIEGDDIRIAAQKLGLVLPAELEQVAPGVHLNVNAVAKVECVRGPGQKFRMTVRGIDGSETVFADLVDIRRAAQVLKVADPSTWPVTRGDEPTWRDESPGVSLTNTTWSSASTDSMVTELRNRGWDVDGSIQGSPMAWDGFNGVPSALIAHEIEKRHPDDDGKPRLVCEPMEGAK